MRQFDDRSTSRRPTKHHHHYHHQHHYHHHGRRDGAVSEPVEVRDGHLGSLSSLRDVLVIAALCSVRHSRNLCTCSMHPHPSHHSYPPSCAWVYEHFLFPQGNPFPDFIQSSDGRFSPYSSSRVLLFPSALSWRRWCCRSRLRGEGERVALSSQTLFYLPLRDGPSRHGAARSSSTRDERAFTFVSLSPSW